jgi:hypothetical protein
LLLDADSGLAPETMTIPRALAVGPDSIRTRAPCRFAISRAIDSPARCLRRRLRAPIEPLEHERPLGFGNARSVVVDRQRRFAATLQPERDAHAAPP